MMYSKTDNPYVVVLDKGEKVVASLTQFCKDAHIKNATFTGIGAVEYLRCGYYALSEKKYYMKEYDSLIEVVSLTGNVMLKDDEPFVHMHGVFTGTDNLAFGGHIEEMVVGVTLEIILFPLSGHLGRVLNEQIGLCLIEPKQT